MSGVAGCWQSSTMRLMTVKDVTPEQAAQLMATIGRQLRYLNRLCRRMDRLGFPRQDPLWQAAWTARDAMQDLHMAAHYAGCTSGVGR